MNPQNIITTIIILILSVTLVSASESTDPGNTVDGELIVCDHNGDGDRDLSDVALLAQCIDTFDANEDGIHNLADIALYTQNYMDDSWCAKVVSECTPEEEEENSLIVCDHNNDEKRDLSDIAILTQHKDTFDVNRDGKHDLSDIGLYTQNAHDDEWCYSVRDQFGYEEEEEEELVICDHNADGERNLADVSILARYKDSFDVNRDGVHNLADVSTYTLNAHDDEWCYSVRDQFGYAEEDSLIICDHNDDGKRNLADVSILTQYKDSFDVNYDGVHNLADVSLYTLNYDDNAWCYSVRDQFGYEEEEEEEDPVISLLGANPQIIELGEEYVELGAEVENGNDENLEIDTSALDIHAVGSYEVIYSFEDADSEVRTVTVEDTTAPSIALSTSPRNPDEDEETDINVVVRDESLVELDVKVYFDDDLKEEFSRSNVDTEAEFEFTPNRDGDYTIVVVATDSEGNSVTEEFELDVDDRNRGSSSRRYQGNSGDVRVIYNNDEETEDIQTGDEETDAIEFRTIDMDAAEEIVPSDMEETDAKREGNSITGSVIGDSAVATNIWVGLLILLIIVAVLGILYVTVWSKN